MSGLVVFGEARAALASACSPGTGVTVVVDFASLGGGVSTACFTGDPATGLAALQGAGFTVTGTRSGGAWPSSAESTAYPRPRPSRA